MPEGRLLRAAEPLPEAPGLPAILKAQVPVGGRGKAGGIRPVETRDALGAEADALFGSRVRGFEVRELRLETEVTGARELYLGLAVDGQRGDVALLASAGGGVDVEQARVARRHAPPEAAALRAALDGLLGELPEAARPALRAAGRAAIEAFVDLEATLLEINPLFLRPDGAWLAGDVRLAADENALPRQPWLAELLERRGAAYPEAALKAGHGFDLVVVDPEGEVGLVSTGAGLSMHLIDEMAALGLRPFNFCDVRSGGMHDDPSRLIEAFRQATAGARVRCVLVSIFAGITELGHFAALLLRALNAMPDMRRPVVLRLVGNGQDEAERLIAASGRPLIVEPRLEAALAACRRLCREATDA